MNFELSCYLLDFWSIFDQTQNIGFKIQIQWNFPSFEVNATDFSFGSNFSLWMLELPLLLKSHESKCLKVTMKCTTFQLVKSFTSFYFALLKFHTKILLEFSTRSVISVLSIYFRNYACNRICKHEVLCSLGVLLGWNIHYNLLFFDKWNTSQTNTALLLGIHFENHQLAQIIIKISLATR